MIVHKSINSMNENGWMDGWMDDDSNQKIYSLFALFTACERICGSMMFSFDLDIMCKNYKRCRKSLREACMYPNRIFILLFQSKLMLIIFIL